MEGITRFELACIPQGPTGMRLVIELLEGLVLHGEVYGLFTGCAAGDIAAALVVHVSEA